MIPFAKQVLEREIEAISNTLAHLDGNFETAVNILLNTTGKVIVTGMGKSGIIARKIAATFASTGTPSFFVHPAEAGHGDLGMIEHKDVIVILSNSGETAELKKILPFLSSIEAQTISITSQPNSTIAQNTHVHLSIFIDREACPLNLAPSASTTASLALGDALALTVSHLKGFAKKDYARFHPEGSLGEKLLHSIEHVMHSGDAIPLVQTSCTFDDIISEITKKKLGFTLCIDKNNTLAGIITDGDIRRSVQKFNADLMSIKAEDIMHCDPMKISRHATVSEAIEKMEKAQITTLVITDSKNNIEGVVHLHDLLGRGELKITL